MQHRQAPPQRAVTSTDCAAAAAMKSAYDIGGIRKAQSYTGARTLTVEQAEAWNKLCVGTAIERKFPMYVLPVSEVLALDKLRPHEELKAKLANQPVDAVVSCVGNCRWVW